jgi:hypothetical protein
LPCIVGTLAQGLLLLQLHLGGNLLRGPDQGFKFMLVCRYALTLVLPQFTACLVLIPDPGPERFMFCCLSQRGSPSYLGARFACLSALRP